MRVQAPEGISSFSVGGQEYKVVDGIAEVPQEAAGVLVESHGFKAISDDDPTYDAVFDPDKMSRMELLIAVRAAGIAVAMPIATDKLRAIVKEPRKVGDQAPAPASVDPVAAFLAYLEGLSIDALDGVLAAMGPKVAAIKDSKDAAAHPPAPPAEPAPAADTPAAGQAPADPMPPANPPAESPLAPAPALDPEHMTREQLVAELEKRGITAIEEGAHDDHLREILADLMTAPAKA